MDAILCAVDGSDRASEAFERALEIAEVTRADLHLLHVVDRNHVGEPALSSGELLVIEREDEGRKLLERLADRAREAGVDVETRTCRGDPADEVLRQTEEADADLLVLGARGTDHEEKLGTVTRRVCGTCDRRLMVV
ncbi:universal stress protein [Halomicrobium salinisoli]|uniref:universal stress protein n=1 Tax=Halomicrobium salinisoli TaxID=2878391 RepID=UPI001CF059DE|nr:universal stress protein [Halomicrobium salinisoli]